MFVQHGKHTILVAHAPPVPGLSDTGAFFWVLQPPPGELSQVVFPVGPFATLEAAVEHAKHVCDHHLDLFLALSPSMWVH